MAISVWGSFVLYILLASSIHTVYPNNIDGCPPIHVQKNRILRTKESLNDGAKYIRREYVRSAKECYKLCCESRSCNLGMLSYKNSSSVFGEIIRTCYLFDCGSPSKCTYSSYNHYATIEFEDGSHDKSSKIDQNPKSGSTKAHHEESCPPGVPVAMCMNDPCNKAACPGNPLALCKPNFCGTCHAEFYDDDGSKVNCYAHSNEAGNVKKSNEYKWLDSGIFAENEKPQSNTHQKPVHQNIQDLESRLHEMTKDNHQQSHQSTRVSTDQEQHRKSWSNQGSDGSKNEAPAHTLRGSSSHRQQKPAPTDPPFHEWRKYIDNNPDYPKAKLVTEKPKPRHTPRPTQRPTPRRTPRPTTYKSTEPFHHWREFIDNNPKYDKTIKTSTTKHPAKAHITPKTKPATKDNKPKPVDTKIPPKVDDNASSKRNITDVKVVIETNHLRIVENKAVVPLAIFLVVALVLLIVVGLRLRMMKNRLRRKAFATDDADYLINGMYL